jgi:phosphate starvation-inducible PhoH-like protein
MPRKKKQTEALSKELEDAWAKSAEAINIHLKGKRFSQKQRELFKLATLAKTNIVFIGGPAGSAKTYLSVYSAMSLLCKNKDLDLLYVRTVIESADKGLGALPGAIEEKFNPYMSPLLDKLEEMIPHPEISELMKAQRVSAVPINYLRGASWRDKIVIADEAQNFTFKELTTLVTRIGEGTKLFICGDYMQSDINGKSGFKEMVNLFSGDDCKENGIHVFNFNKDDIFRSKILRFIIEKMESK